MTKHVREHDGNVRTLIISEHQPIFVRALVEAAKNFAPGEFTLAGEFGIHDAFVEYATFSVFPC